MIKVIGVALVCALFALMLKDKQKPIAYMISAMGVCVLCVGIIPYIGDIMQTVNDIASKGNINGEYVEVLIKAVGICTAATLTQNILIDNGENALAFLVEICAKCFVVIIAFPLVLELFEILLKIL